jgi:hypothetical protein
MRQAFVPVVGQTAIRRPHSFVSTPPRLHWRVCCLNLVLTLASAPTGAADGVSARIVVQNAPLAGFVYYEGRSVWQNMKIGDPLTLVREPENVHDTNAVRIDWRGHMLGYVPRRDNPDLARQMDHGARIEARVTGLNRAANGRHRISYEISVPLK